MPVMLTFADDYTMAYYAEVRWLQVEGKAFWAVCQTIVFIEVMNVEGGVPHITQPCMHSVAGLLSFCVIQRESKWVRW